MPKARQTCTRCSMRRQKCDRKIPCSRCVKNKEPHLCSLEWPDGYDANVHRKYPKRQLTETPSPAIATQPYPTPSDARGQSISNVTEGSVLAGSPLNPLATRRETQHEPDPKSIEFITWGKSKLSDFNITSLISSKDQESANGTKAQDDAPSSPISEQPETISPPARAVEMYHLQALIPSKPQVLHLVKYHETFMAYYAGIVHPPLFRQSLYEAYRASPSLQLKDLDYRWTALLFAVLSASLLCSPASVSASWGFTNSQKKELAQKWYKATISCLLLGDFASKLHLYSIQAILTMNCSAHLLGNSKEFLVYLGAAHSIAKGLGLHRLAQKPDEATTWATVDDRDSLVQREIGRRIWSALCFQDWFATSSTGMYTLNPKHFTTALPGYYDDESMKEVGNAKPTLAHFNLYLHGIGSLIREFFNSMLDVQQLDDKYEIVLRYDAKLRTLHKAEKAPAFFRPDSPVDPSWPRWVQWARRELQICTQHKIIMIHQNFLSRSFKNGQYAYSRWACTNSSKYIIEMQEHIVREAEQPAWWVQQAFVVTSGITLALDIFHRSDKDPEYMENKAWIERAIKLLQQWSFSAMASHGVRLLTSLLHERIRKTGLRPGSDSSSAGDMGQSLSNDVSSSEFPAFAGIIGQPRLQEIDGDAEDQAHGDGGFAPMTDAEMVDFERLLEDLPYESGLDHNAFFEDILQLTHNELL